jgi:hypothetical protein
MNYELNYPYQIKQKDIKELVNGIVTLGDFYTYSQASELKSYLYDFNGTRYGPIEQIEQTDIFDGITIRDVEDNMNKTAIVRYHRGEFSINIDISTCPTRRSLLYFAFQKWFDYKEMMEFRQSSVNVTPNKRRRF